MHWQKQVVEEFFGAQFTFIEPLHELRFEAGGMRYRLWLDDQRHLLVLTGDVHNADDAFPAIEIGCRCERIEQTQAIGVGPVLLFYDNPDNSQEHLRLCITRTGDRRFSIAPRLASA
jgi:hypothetical protein